MLLELLYLFSLIVLYFIVAYIMVILYEKGVTIFKIRLFLVLTLLAYVFYKSNKVWSYTEIHVIIVILLAHLFTIYPRFSNNSFEDDEQSMEEIHEKRSSLRQWIFNFLLLSWLLDDDDDWHWF